MNATFLNILIKFQVLILRWKIFGVEDIVDFVISGTMACPIVVIGVYS
jgi:hypothetical protein